MTERTAIALALRTFPFLETEDDARRFYSVLGVAISGLQDRKHRQIETVVERIAASLVQAVDDPQTFNKTIKAMRKHATH